jgi:hypothetical protein
MEIWGKASSEAYGQAYACLKNKIVRRGLKNPQAVERLLKLQTLNLKKHPITFAEGTGRWARQLSTKGALEEIQDLKIKIRKVQNLFWKEVKKKGVEVKTTPEIINYILAQHIIEGAKLPKWIRLILA